MNRKNNSTWTDELRSAFENAELKPSEGSWERLQADLGRRRGAAWFPYAGLAAALAAVALGVFLFQPHRKSSQDDITVVSSGAAVAQAPEVVEQLPESAALAPEALEKAADVTLAQAKKPSSAWKASPSPEVTPVEAAPLQEAAPTVAETVPVEEAAPAEEKAPIKEEAPQEKAPQYEAVPTQNEVSQIQPVAPERGRERRKIRISLAGGGLGGDQGTAAPSYTPAADYRFTTLMTKSSHEVLAVAQPDYVTDISELIEHQVPVKVGINLDIPIGRNSYIGSGIEYFYLNSSVAGERQTLHWLGVPLNYKYRLVNKQTWAAGLGAGATVEKCLNASLLGHDYKEDAQFSAKVFADLRIALTPVLSLYACPELSYYFTETNLPIYRSGKPLAFGVTAGLAIEL